MNLRADKGGVATSEKVRTLRKLLMFHILVFCIVGTFATNPFSSWRKILPALILVKIVTMAISRKDEIGKN